MAYMSAFTKNLGGEVSRQNLQDELDVNVGKDKTEVTGKETLKVKFEDTQNCYKIAKNGQVTKDTSGNIPDDIFVALYNDGTLVFSNNEASIDTTKVSKNYGNIKDIEYPEWNENITKVDIINKIYPKNMGGWFAGMDITSIDSISNIDTSNCTSLDGLFFDCFSLQRIDLSSFNTENVTSMACMFYNCAQLTDINFGDSFSTQNVTQMHSMFYNCYLVTTLDLSSFDTRKVESISDMFHECNSLETIYASNWNTNAIVIESSGLLGEMERNIFGGCTSLVGEKGTAYDSSKVSYDYAHIDGGTSNPGYFTTLN